MTTLTPSQTQTVLIGKTLSELETLLAGWGEPAYRARQLHSWLYVKNARDFEMMTDLGKTLRHKLAEETTIGSLTLAEKQESQDGTLKYLFRLPDGNVVESVLMFFEDRPGRSICISTQVGCAVNCSFCATGKLGFKRNLSPGEIVEQLLFVEHDSGEVVRNVVFMGQGEPLLNYERFMQSLRLINQSAEVGMRHITVSTSGIVPAIDKLAEEQLQLTLAISLHAADNETREAIMPLNKKWPLETLIPALVRYQEKTGRRLTIEYIMLAGINDRPDHAKKLVDLLKPLKCHINLIPYNPIGEDYGFERPPLDHIYWFRNYLTAAGKITTVRLERGTDIAAACGQLANRYLSD